jgi:hypothetical protein
VTPIHWSSAPCTCAIGVAPIVCHGLVDALVKDFTSALDLQGSRSTWVSTLTHSTQRSRTLTVTAPVPPACCRPAEDQPRTAHRARLPRPRPDHARGPLAITRLSVTTMGQRFPRCEPLSARRSASIGEWPSIITLSGDSATSLRRVALLARRRVARRTRPGVVTRRLRRSNRRGVAGHSRPILRP